MGTCRNADCKAGIVHDSNLKDQRRRCIICGEMVRAVCCRCGKGYCDTHSQSMNETSLASMNQHLGTCVICGEIICEHCWIFNKKGQVTCQIHYSGPKHDE
ncbi:MAG: hypothetical protein C4K48_03240 [Candidatus Thorarchaeota archaeon]|nr:MAG: hypothetical protein C4K48_03240 [Candidatus Thorarchaeota archaeon]